MSALTFVTLALAGFGIGGLASLLGVGGGIFMVPLLLLGGFVDTTQAAVGTSILGVVFTSLSGSIAYARKRLIHYRLGLVIMPVTVLAAWSAARLTAVIASRWLSVAFGVFLLYPIVTMLRGKSGQDVRLSLRGKLHGARAYALAVVAGVLAGAGNGLFGIGGGTVLVPFFAIFLGLDILTAVATSLFVMLPSSVVASYQHWIQGNLRTDLALPLVVGLALGAQLGPYLGSRISRNRLRQLFGLVLLYAAVNVVVNALR
jgi:uncharacterized membrane protein YfcA